MKCSQECSKTEIIVNDLQIVICREKIRVQPIFTDHGNTLKWFHWTTSSLGFLVQQTFGGQFRNILPNWKKIGIVTVIKQWRHCQSWRNLKLANLSFSRFFVFFLNKKVSKNGPKKQNIYRSRQYFGSKVVNNNKVA